MEAKRLVERGVWPGSESKAQAFAQALRGMADGFDQKRPWFRPDPLVMSTLRRAADELDKTGDAVAAERERWMKAATAALDILDALPAWSNAGYACQLLREALGPNVGQVAAYGADVPHA